MHGQPGNQICVRTLRQEEIDPRYRNVDPKFIEVIENEILSEVSLRSLCLCIACPRLSARQLACSVSLR